MGHRVTHQDTAKGHKDAESFLERAGYARGGKVHMTNVIIHTDNPQKQQQAAMQGMKIGAALGARRAAQGMQGMAGRGPSGPGPVAGAAGPRLPTAAPGQPPMGPPTMAAKGGKIPDLSTHPLSRDGTWGDRVRVRAHTRRRSGGGV